MRQYNGVDYDTLYPKTTTDQINGVLPIEKGGTNATTGSGVIRNLANTVNSLILNAEDEILVSAHNGLAGKTTLSALATLVSSIGDGAKIQTGSYVGTGTYGSSNPCSLTFDFEPKVLLVEPKGMTGGPPCITLVCGVELSQILIFENQRTFLQTTWSENTVSWYTNSADAVSQLNGNGNLYHYCAIG